MLGDCLYNLAWARLLELSVQLLLGQATGTVCTTSPRKNSAIVTVSMKYIFLSGSSREKFSDCLYNFSGARLLGPTVQLLLGLATCLDGLCNFSCARLLGLSVQLLLGQAFETVCTTSPGPGYWDCLYNFSWARILGLSVQLLLGQDIGTVCTTSPGPG
jgi:hypothetical protein